MLPNVTAPNSSTGVEPYKQGSFDAYISYCALGGILTEDDGETHRMSLEEFCRTYNVTRMTLNRWKKQTPDWDQRVDRRRKEIVPLARVSAVWNSVYLIARQTQDKRAAVEAQKLFLGHHGLELPVQRQQVKVEHSLTEMFAKADQVIEGEVVNGPRPSIEDAPEATVIPPAA